MARFMHDYWPGSGSHYPEVDITDFGEFGPRARRELETLIKELREEEEREMYLLYTREVTTPVAVESCAVLNRPRREFI